MLRLAAHVASRILAWISVSLAGAALLFFASQGNKIAGVLSGASASLAEMSALIGLLSVPVLGWALTPAFAVAVFAVAGAMSARKEMNALDAAGIPRWKTAAGAWLVALALCGVSAVTWFALAPGAQGEAIARATEIAGRAVAGGIRPGRFDSPAEGITVYADEREGDLLRGVMIASDQDPSVVVSAREALVRYDSRTSELVLDLRDGRAFLRGTGRAAAGFDELKISIDLGEELEAALGFIPGEMAAGTGELLGPPPAGRSPVRWSFAFWRRVGGVAGFACFALLSLVVAFRVRWRRRGLALFAAGAVFLGFHVLARLFENLMEAGTLDAPAAALLPSVAVLSLGVATLLAPLGGAPRGAIP